LLPAAPVAVVANDRHAAKAASPRVHPIRSRGICSPFHPAEARWYITQTIIVRLPSLQYNRAPMLPGGSTPQPQQPEFHDTLAIVGQSAYQRRQ
jgi:hypothetical protein